MYDNLLKLS